MTNEVLSIRKSLGLTQGQLAERLGVDLNTVWRWENGHSTPSAITMIALRSLVPPCETYATASVTPAAMDAARYEEALTSAAPECAP